GDCDAVLAFRLSTLHLIHPHRPRACITAARRDLTVCLRAFVSLPRTMSLTATKSVPPARPQGRMPDKIGKYAVIREVGRGSTGAAYLSHDAAYCRPDNLLRIDDTVEIMFKCAKALHYAHSRGVIHRDVKPSNIMLTQDSDVRIIDFGIALVSDSDVSRIEGIAGSPSYMSPEQV